MKILFCKIACMKYYKGTCDKDIPYNGGSFVKEHGYGYEENNFNDRYNNSMENENPQNPYAYSPNQYTASD